MFEGEQADLTKYLPSWLPYVGTLALGVGWFVREWRRLKRSDDGAREAEVEKAVRPYKEIAETAERQKAQAKEDLAEAEREAEQWKRRYERKAEAVDELQEKVMRFAGRLDNAEERLRALEYKNPDR